MDEIIDHEDADERGYVQLEERTLPSPGVSAADLAAIDDSKVPVWILSVLGGCWLFLFAMSLLKGDSAFLNTHPYSAPLVEVNKWCSHARGELSAALQAATVHPLFCSMCLAVGYYIGSSHSSSSLVSLSSLHSLRATYSSCTSSRSVPATSEPIECPFESTSLVLQESVRVGRRG